MFLNLFLLGFGITSLLLGGSLLIKTTVSLAKHLKKRVFLVSLILLGGVSSAPELFVTLQSHFKSEASIALGNIIGSNIFNILIVGSLMILTQAKITNKNTITKNACLLLVATLITATLTFDGSFSRLDGLGLLILFGIFFTKPFIQSQTAPPEELKEEENEKTQNPYLLLFFTALGFGLLFLGSHLTIESSVFIAKSFNIPRRIIGLFIVSIGTSLPELTIGLAALFKKKSGVALGSIIGSNTFNTFFIPGIASLLFAFPLSPSLIKIDGFFMCIAELLLLLYLIWEKFLPQRISGVFFIFLYACYCVFALTPSL